MTVSPELIRQAIDDLATVRKAIEAAGQEDRPSRRRVVTRTHLLVQVVALGLALLLLAVELATGNLASQALAFSPGSDDIRGSTIATMGQMLLVLVAALYFVVHRASRAEQRDFAGFVARNFAYLRNLSFLSDLAVKFAVVALVIHLRAPEWVAPLLLLFTGDFLMQGRFFTLPLRSALVLGVACVAGALALRWTGQALLAWPLCAFAAVTAVSVVYAAKLHREAPAEGGTAS